MITKTGSILAHTKGLASGTTKVLSGTLKGLNWVSKPFTYYGKQLVKNPSRTLSNTALIGTGGLVAADIIPKYVAHVNPSAPQHTYMQHGRIQRI